MNTEKTQAQLPDPGVSFRGLTLSCAFTIDKYRDAPTVAKVTKPL